MTAALYIGETRHTRLYPNQHSFRYRLFQLLLDVDRIQQDMAGLRWLRHGRFGLFSFSERDHGARSPHPLRTWVETRLEEAGLASEATTIRLLCFPRILGFVFNPLSLFFVYSANDRLEAVIYEVNNTFGQTHAYVVPASGGEREHQQAEKVFFVSPFYRVEGEYQFEITPPRDKLSLSIQKRTGGRADFHASLIAQRQPLTDKALLKLFFAMPLMTLGVVAAIHWEALRLLLKGAKFQRRPPGPRSGASTGRQLAQTAKLR